MSINLSIEEIQQELIDEFGLFDNWMDKYELIIQLGKDLPIINEAYKINDNLIKGCQSKVWLHSEFKDDHVWFTADSDAIITKGLVSLVIKVLNAHTPSEIKNARLHFIDEIGLNTHLSPTRSNGLLSMIRQMQLIGLAYESRYT